MFGKGKNPRGINISHHHQGRVVGRVPLAIPVPQVGDLHPFQVTGPTNHRVTVWGNLVGHGVELLESQGLRVILGAQAAFFLDYLQFLDKLRRGQGQGAHPLRLKFEGNGETISGQGLKVGRVVPAGEGVFVPAVGGDDAGEFARSELFRALEHHVFKQMGNTGESAGFVTGADFVPDLRGNDRRPSVLLDEHLEPVAEGPLVDLAGICRGGR